MASPLTFDFDKEDAAQLINGDPIGSAALDVAPAGIAFKPGFSIPCADVTLSAASRLTVQAFNSLDDADADNVLLPAAAAGKPPRMLSLTAKGAWLKYRLDANVKASVKASLSAAGFNIDGSAGVVLADYRFHPDRAETVRAGFVADVAAGARTVFDRASVERLQPGDAVTLQAQGAIAAKVTVSFSDLFTMQATGLLALGGQKAVAFKATAGVTATFNVRVTDEFVVSFAAVDAATWRIGVRTARARTIGAGIAATFDVEAADPEELAAFLTEIKDALLGQPLNKAKDLLNKATLGTLTADQQAQVGQLLDRFGLAGTVDALKALQGKLDDVDNKLEDVLQQIAAAKIKVGFAYEYARMDEDNQLLQMTVDRNNLRAVHGDLIRGDLGSAIAVAAKGGSGVSLEQFLNQSALIRRKSWGFTLGIGKWVDVGGTDTDKLTVVKRRNLEGRVQESYLGTRGYEARWQGDLFHWAADFRADMRAYAQNAMPTLPEFDLGLHLALAASHAKLSSDDIDEYIDFAACWGIVADEDIVRRRQDLQECKGAAQDVSIQLTIGDEAFRHLLPSIAGAADGDLAFALALAMPCQPKQPGLRTPAERLAVYRRVWEFYLTHPDAGVEERSVNAAAILKAEGQAALADVEKNAPAPHPLLDFTMSGRVSSDGDPLDRWRTFRNGAALLQQALVSGGPAETALDRGRRNMQACWTQVHHLRAIGAFLLDRARTAGVLNKIGRSFTITPQKVDGQTKGMIIVA